MDRGTATATRETEDSERDAGLSRRGRLRARVAGLFSVYSFLLALALSTAGVLAGNAVPLVGNVAGIVGVGIAAAVLGLAGRHAYLEAAAAGFIAAGVATLLDFLVVSLVAGPTVVAVGTGAGALAATVGHYFGRDLRAGLTRDL